MFGNLLREWKEAPYKMIIFLKKLLFEPLAYYIDLSFQANYIMDSIKFNNFFII